MMKLVMSTCGTSLLTNAPGEAAALLRQTASLTADALSAGQRAGLDAHAATCAERLMAAGPAEAASLSAELRTLSMAGDLADDRRGRDHHILVVSDTYQGALASRVLTTWLERRLSVEVLAIRGLSPASYPTFRAALGDLARACLDLIEQHRAAGRRVVFNLNGGFKAVQGFMQTLGCHCADECLYVFETGSELIRIPRLPLVLDPEGVVGRFLPAFRTMAAGLALPRGTVAGIPETLLFELDGEAVLSEWGQIVWRGSRDRYYGAGLLAPPHERIVYAGRFEREAARLTPDRLVEINRQIDALVGCLASDLAWNPKSLSLHRLRGDPVPGSTHEFYAWSDRDAARVFGHFEPGGRFVVDQMGSHL